MTVWWETVHGLKYQKFTTSGCKDVEIRKSDFKESNQGVYLERKEEI